VDSESTPPRHLSPDDSEPLRLLATRMFKLGTRRDGQRRCVTRDHVNPVIQRHALRLGYAPGSLTLHSFRSGSATPALVMQIQGGWTSAQPEGSVPYLRHNVGAYQRASDSESDAQANYADDWRAGLGVEPRCQWHFKLVAGSVWGLGISCPRFPRIRVLAPTLPRRRGSVAPSPVSARGGHGGVGAASVVGLQSSQTRLPVSLLAALVPAVACAQGWPVVHVGAQGVVGWVLSELPTLRRGLVGGKEATTFANLRSCSVAVLALRGTGSECSGTFKLGSPSLRQPPHRDDRVDAAGPCSL
jgi:hypothetical protein